MKKAFPSVSCGILLTALALAAVSVSAQAADQSSKSAGMGSQAMSKLCAAQYAVIGKGSSQVQSQVVTWLQKCPNKPYPSNSFPCDGGTHVRYERGKCTVDQYICVHDSYYNVNNTNSTFPVFWNPLNIKAGVECS